MASHTDIEGMLFELRAIEDIKKLKHGYWRVLDQYLEDQIGEFFAEDAVCDFLAYGEIVGRPAIVEFFKNRVYPAYQMMVHQGTCPEIEITSRTTATGIWSYEAWMFAKSPIVGYWHTGYYEDKYVVEGGRWKIQFSKGTHYFNTRVVDQWVKERFSHGKWPPEPPAQG